VAVAVGGALIAVWVAAAPAVKAMAVRGPFGSKVGMGAGVEPNEGTTHASIRINTAVKETIL
jgi:hypothetical protein